MVRYRELLQEHAASQKEKPGGKTIRRFLAAQHPDEILGENRISPLLKYITASSQ